MAAGGLGTREGAPARVRSEAPLLLEKERGRNEAEIPGQVCASFLNTCSMDERHSSDCLAHLKEMYYAIHVLEPGLGAGIKAMKTPSKYIVSLTPLLFYGCINRGQD